MGSEISYEELKHKIEKAKSWSLGNKKTEKKQTKSNFLIEDLEEWDAVRMEVKKGLKWKKKDIPITMGEKTKGGQ